MRCKINWYTENKKQGKNLQLEEAVDIDRSWMVNKGE